MIDLTGWTIVFDLDGTLVDTAPDLVHAMNHALEAEGYQPAPHAVGRQFIGSGAKAMLRGAAEWQGLTLSEDVIHTLWERFIPYYKAHIADHSALFPDATEALEELERYGAILAVCTNKTQGLTDQLIDTLAIRSIFKAIVGSDSVPSKKPDGDHIRRTVLAAGGIPAKTIMIGDSTTDAGAAADLGVPLVFANFGYGPAPESSAPNTYWLEDYSSLVTLVRGIAVKA